MAAALPGYIRLKLDQALAQWRRWDCQPPLAREPVVQRVLGEGLSNHSVLVESGNCFVVRIDGIDPSANQLNRWGEWRSLQAAHCAGIAPRPRYFNPDLGCLVCDYLPPDEEPTPSLSQLARLVRAIHALPPRHHRLDLVERISKYENRLLHRSRPIAAEVTAHSAQVLQCLRSAQAADHTRVLCHNDLLRANRIYSGGELWALDWEYCAMGSLWYDLAVIVAGDGLGSTQVRSLLEAYLERPATAAEHRRLQQYACVYRYLELLWYLALEKPLPGGEQIEPRLHRLDTDLDQLISP